MVSGLLVPEIRWANFWGRTLGAARKFSESGREFGVGQDLLDQLGHPFGLLEEANA